MLYLLDTLTVFSLSSHVAVAVNVLLVRHSESFSTDSSRIMYWLGILIVVVYVVQDAF